MATATTTSVRFPIARIATISAIGAVCLWAYWPSFVEMASIWSRRPEYSHGWMVPLFAIFLLWRRTDLFILGDENQARIGAWVLGTGVAAWLGPWLFEFSGAVAELVQWAGMALAIGGFAVLVSGWLSGTDFRPNWWGLVPLLFAVGIRHYAATVYLEWIDFISLIPFLAGIVLLTGGKRLLRWSGIAIVFLFFMIPLPFRLEVALRGPLQRAGTLASTYAMQTMGLPAFSEGNVVTVNEVGINVVEACSGLRMMMVFFALSVGLAIILDRPLWQRLLLAASAIPIALIANILRITTTGLLYVYGYDRLAEDFFHDFAGWVMPLIGVALLQLELWYLDRLFIVDQKKPLRFGIRTPEVPEPVGN